MPQYDSDSVQLFVDTLPGDTVRVTVDQQIDGTPGVVVNVTAPAGQQTTSRAGFGQGDFIKPTDGSNTELEFQFTNGPGAFALSAEDMTAGKSLYVEDPGSHTITSFNFTQTDFTLTVVFS